MSETNWLDDSEARMWRAFIEMRYRLEVAMDRQLVRDAGLSGADYAVLVPLSETPDAKLRARELGRLLDWDRSRLSHQIRRMEERGLIKRSECVEDARGTIIELSANGLAAIENAAPGHVETVRRLFIDELNADEIALLTAISNRVLSRIAEDEGETHVPASCPTAQGKSSTPTG